MTNFDHVVDDTLRSVLMGDLSEDALCYALQYTYEAALADQLDEDVPYSVSEQRLSLASRAMDWWNEEGDFDKAVDTLRACWGV